MDVRHGPQTSAVQYVGVPTHWSGAGNSQNGGDRGIYHPLPEHGREIHYNQSYHRILFCGGAEAGNAPIQAMVETARPVYHGDQGRAGIRRGEGGDGG